MARRPSCERCRRPRVTCYCADVPSLPTRTRILLLQHPKERGVGIGTARMAHLSLPNSILRVGLDFSADPLVRATLAAPHPVCVLFPKPGALDVSELPRDRPITLVVLDGTWSLARKLLRLNPAVAELPRVAFTPRRPSDYRIRRQPSAICVSTIEALAEVLEVIEPDNGPFDRLLTPFHSMVARQLAFITGVAAHRHRRARRPPPPPRDAMLAARLAADWSRLVCVQGDTNAWPRRHPGRHPPEIVHWVAHRPASGETYEMVLAPRRPLAATTPAQIELPPARLFAGESVETWRRSWRAFCRPDDVVVTWGTFYAGLAAQDDLVCSPQTMDLRAATLRVLQAPHLRGEAARSARAYLRTVDLFAASFGVSCSSLGIEGRAGRRLDALVAVLGALARQQLTAAPARSPSDPPPSPVTGPSMEMP